MPSSGARLTLTIIGSVVVAAAVAFRIFVWPSLAFPDTDPTLLEARWTAVERHAARFGAAPAGSPRLLAAAAALAEWPEASDAPGSDPPAIDPSLLHPAGRRAVDALVQWAAENGEINDTCQVDVPPTAIALFHLGRLGLRSSVSADDLPFAAALRLAAALRQHGALLGGVVGFQLADDALTIARDRGWDARALFIAHKPTPEELRALVARESVCAYRLIDRVFSEGCDRDDAPWFYPLSAERWCQRERQIFKDYWGAVHEAADATADLHAFADALELPDIEALPASPTLRGTAVTPADAVRRAIDVLARHDALAGGPPDRDDD